MAKYTTKKGQMGDTILHIDEIQSVCPFSQPLMAQGNMGQIQILRMPCSNACPLATIEDGFWVTKCGSQDIARRLEEDSEEEPKEPSKLIMI